MTGFTEEKASLTPHAGLISRMVARLRNSTHDRDTVIRKLLPSHSGDEKAALADAPTTEDGEGTRPQNVGKTEDAMAVQMQVQTFVDEQTLDDLRDYLDCIVPATESIPASGAADWEHCFESSFFSPCDVYPPSDDSLLLVEVVCRHVAERVERSQGGGTTTAAEHMFTVLEVGCGSGFVSASVMRAVLESDRRRICDMGRTSGSDDPPQLRMLCTDLNTGAVKFTERLLRERVLPACSQEPACESPSTSSTCASQGPEGMQGDRVELVIREDNFFDRLCADSLCQPHGVDLLVFNPPYVCADEGEEAEVGVIAHAWAGGGQGRNAIDEILPRVRPLLRLKHGDNEQNYASEKGRFFLIGVVENDPTEILEKARRCYGLRGKKVAQETRGIEELYVLEFEPVEPEDEDYRNEEEKHWKLCNLWSDKDQN
ncbi:unnamed protein product [Amoebophrya sp. A25]|nr:unnamed protein product [Amoebophrya sp. A25]|eukprot:GSA25T00011777001.1